MDKELKLFFKEILSQGAVITDGGKHYKVRTPNNRLVVCSKTPSDKRAILNMRKDYKHALAAN